MLQEGPCWPPSPRAATVKSGGLLRHVWWLGQAPHRRGVTEDGRQLTFVDDAFAEREPALFALARAAVSVSSPA